MLNLLRQWLKSAHFLKIFASLVVISFVIAVDLTFCMLKAKANGSLLAVFFYLLSMVKVTLSFIYLVVYTGYRGGFNFPRPRYKYYLSLITVFAATYIVSGWPFCLVLLIGFIIGFKK